MPSIETEIPVPDIEKFSTKLPVFVDYQKITPDDLNLLSGALQGDNPISMVLNLLRILASNYRVNLYDVSASSPYYDKQFISPIYSKPSVPVTIIGMDVDADSFSSTNKVFKIKPGLILFDFMAYTIPEFIVKASGEQGYIVAKFSEEDFGEKIAEYYNLDEDRFIQARKFGQKIYKVKLLEVTVDKDGSGNPIPPQTVENSLPLFSYQIVNGKFIIRMLQMQTPLTMNPQYVTTKDILGEFIELGRFTLDNKTLTITDYPPERKFIENGVQYSILRDSLDFRHLVKPGDVLRIESEFYRKVISVQIDKIVIDKGMGMVSSSVQLDLLPVIGLRVEKALSLSHSINSKFARWEIGDIKYKMEYKPSSPEFPFLGLFSPTRVLNINNFPRLVPFMRNYRLSVPASVGYASSNLKTEIFTPFDKFPVEQITRLSVEGRSNTLIIKFKPSDAVTILLKSLLDDEISRKYLDPAEFSPRTLTLGENCIVKAPLREIGLNELDTQSVVETFAYRSGLELLSMKAGTYSIKTINVDGREISINVNDIQLASSVVFGSTQFEQSMRSLNDIISGMSTQKIDIRDTLVEFYPYRLPDVLSSAIGTIIVQGKTYSTFNNTKVTNTVRHFAIPGNGFIPRIINGESATGGVEHIVGAVNGWDRYVIPGYAYMYAGEYLGG